MSTVLKVYGINLGYRGGQVVIAETREQAWALLTADDDYGELNHHTAAELTEKSCESGTIFSFAGDA